MDRGIISRNQNGGNIEKPIEQPSRYKTQNNMAPSKTKIGEYFTIPKRDKNENGSSEENTIPEVNDAGKCKTPQERSQ